MTTTIKITSHNYPAMVETVDSGKVTDTRILLNTDGEQTLYCTTTRELRITDLDYEDARVLAEKAKRG